MFRICLFFLLAVGIVYDYYYLLFMYLYTFVTTWFMRYTTMTTTRASLGHAN